MIPLMKNAFSDEAETKKALADFILTTDRLSMGSKCFEFERKFKAYQGSKHAVLFNSGGSSNLAMLQALKNLGKLAAGDKIGFSALTWSTNLMPIIQMGFQPVPLDITPLTLNVMSDNLKDRLSTHELDAVLITNALGFCGDLDNIKDLCEESGALLLEDNCEALGTELVGGKKTGTFGVASSFSFFVAHHLSTIEGGMLCVDDDDLAEMLVIVRANGWDRNLNASRQHRWREKYDIASELEAKYAFYDLGFNFRPTEITGFLGCHQMELLDHSVQTRQKNYKELLQFVSENPDLETLSSSHIETLSCFAYPILCKNKELKEVYITQFAGAGVEIRPMIAGNIQNQPFYKKYIHERFDLPGADFVHNCGFYCGNYPELNPTDLNVLKSCLQKY